MKSPLDEETKAQMQETIQDTMSTFTAKYTMSYKDMLIAKCQKESEETSYQLVDAPQATEILCKGWMMKLGAVRKNWKKRWFVAMNEDQNYKICYYTTDAMKKCKGEISLCGYSIRDFTEEEKKATGDSGIAMVREGGREWKVRCIPDNDEQRKKWTDALQNACSKAKPPIGANDPVGGGAFMHAYNAVRLEQEVDVPEIPSGTEEEALTSLLLGKLKELIATVIEKIPDGPSKNMTTKAVNNGVMGMIAAAVTAAWKAVSSAMQSTRAILETGIKGALKPINDAKKMLCDKAAEMTSSVIKPVMDKALSTNISPVLDKVMAPVSAGFISSITLFATLAKQVRDKVTADPKSLDGAVSSAYWDAWSNNFDGVGDTVSDVLEKVGDALGGFPGAKIVGMIMDALKNLVKKGLATLRAAIEGGASAAAGYTEVLAKVINDAKLLFVDCLKNLLGGLIKPMFDANVKPLCIEPLAPVDEMIPEPVKTFISVESVVDALCETVIDAAIDGVVEPVTTPQMAKLDELATSLA